MFNDKYVNNFLDVLEEIDNKEKNKEQRIEELNNEKNILIDKLKEDNKANKGREINKLDISRSKKEAEINKLRDKKLRDIDILKENVDKVEEELKEIVDDLRLDLNNLYLEGKNFENISSCGKYIDNNLSELKEVYNRYKFKEDNLLKRGMHKVFNKLEDYDLKVHVLVAVLIINLVYMFFHKVFKLQFKGFVILVLMIGISYLVYKKVLKKLNKDDDSLIIEYIENIKSSLVSYNSLLKLEEDNINKFFDSKVEYINKVFNKAAKNIEESVGKNLGVDIQDISNDYNEKISSFEEEFNKNDFESVDKLNQDILSSGEPLLGSVKNQDKDLYVICNKNNLVINYVEKSDEQYGYIQSILENILNADENIKCSCIDPLNLGESFKYILDNNVESIGVSKGDMLEILEGYIDYISDIIQNTLKDDYDTIYEYNSISKSPIGYKLLVIQDFQFIDDEKVLNLLKIIMRKGVICGVFVVMVGLNIDLNLLNNDYDLIEYENGEYKILKYNKRDLDTVLYKIN